MKTCTGFVMSAGLPSWGLISGGAATALEISVAMTAMAAVRMDACGFIGLMRCMWMASYSTTTTGSPSTSIFGTMPRPGAVLAAMKPLSRCGAPSAVETVT
jgi:hypothetical protein